MVIYKFRRDDAGLPLSVRSIRHCHSAWPEARYFCSKGVIGCCGESDSVATGLPVTKWSGKRLACCFPALHADVKGGAIIKLGWLFEGRRRMARDKGSEVFVHCSLCACDLAGIGKHANDCEPQNALDAVYIL